MIDALKLAFGSELAALLLMIGRSARNIGAAIDVFAGSGAGEPGVWAYSPFAFDQVMAAISEIGKALRPDGEPSTPAELSEMDDFAERLAQREARRVIDAVRGQTPDIPPLRDLRDFGLKVHALLGPAAERLGRDDLDSRRAN
jgi:hypothetical protein